MLHREAVPAGTLDLLTSLCRHPALASFALARGTSLALRFGHRMSVDLDFFTLEPFDSNLLVKELAGTYSLKEATFHDGGLSVSLQDVKVDFVTYRYPLLAPFDLEESGSIRLFSLEDVVAMKLSATTNRGAKKDFFDVTELLRRIGMNEMTGIYERKYPHNDPMIMLRSLIYFEDAEAEPEPQTLIGITWPEVKREIAKAVGGML
jgi:Nucleotidyl transferase AbiEii toxin, Type IV TA system